MPSRPQAVVENIGGELIEYAPVRTTAPTIELLDGSGTVLIASTTAVSDPDPVNTTLTSAVTTGEHLGIGVASIVGIVARRQYRLGPADPATASEPHEFVTVRRVAAATVDLVAPARFAHANGIAFQGTRLRHVVPASAVGDRFTDGVAVWRWTAMATPPITTAVECVRYAATRRATVEDVRVWWPTLSRLLSEHDDVEELLDQAFDTVMLRLGSRFRVHTLRGSDALRRPTAVAFVLHKLILRGVDDDVLARWQTMYDREIEQVTSIWSADDDEDGIVEQHEGPRRRIQLSRTG